MKQDEIEEVVLPPLSERYVFMDKAIQILEVGLKTEKNVILYGPGGHGKSELALDFFYDKGINPYVITMGQGMTSDRMFGGVDIKLLQEFGKIEYLLDNSMFNHEYVIIEEMMDAPDFILEQLKDVFSSGVFRNGTQVYPIKTRFVVCCTNRTRAEYAKNRSLQALMERFPLELEVIWDNYNEASYNKLLETRFNGDIDATIPFILQEYHKNSITISPRIALDAYEVFEECGPESLEFFADFAKKPTIIKEAVAKFQSVIEFKKKAEAANGYIQAINDMGQCRTKEQKQLFIDAYQGLEKEYMAIAAIKVTDELASIHSAVSKACKDKINQGRERYTKYGEVLAAGSAQSVEEIEDQS